MAATVGIVILTGCVRTEIFIERLLETRKVPAQLQEVSRKAVFLEKLKRQQDSRQRKILIPSMNALTECYYFDKKLPAVPKLPSWGSTLSDFVPEGWELLDSVEMDFNGDRREDYIGVLEKTYAEEADYWVYPRILFALASSGDGKYRLDFQDENLIRSVTEGGVFGDPYLPLTAKGNSFTTHSFGGSAWKWEENRTYTYQSGTWYCTETEDFYGYGGYITSYGKEDWKKGIGIYKERSSEFSDMETHWEEETADYDIVYEMSLDAPVTLFEAGKRWWLSTDRVRDWEVQSTEVTAGIELEEKDIKLPDRWSMFDYCDENCVLYTFSHKAGQETWEEYIAMYRWQDKSLTVLAKSDSHIDDLEFYKGKIYYTEEIKEAALSIKESEEGTEAEITGIELNRINPDGTDKETVFTYPYSEAEKEGMDMGVPYLALIYKIRGDEIVVEVYIGSGERHPVYRMKTDGSSLRLIGQIPKETV